MRLNLRKTTVSLKYYSTSASVMLKAGEILTQIRTFSDSDVSDYSKLTFDANPLHFDLECAKLAGFTEIPVPGMLVASLFPRIIASHFPGAVYVKQTLEFKSPVYIGDKIVGEVQSKNIRPMKEKFLAMFSTKCFKDSGDVVITGEAVALLPSLLIKKL